MTKQDLLKEISRLAEKADKANEPALSMLLSAVSGVGYADCDLELLLHILPFTEKLKEAMINEMITRSN